MKTETSIKSLPGVEKRGNSIRISFTTRDGTRHKKTYKLDGIVMAPTGPNMVAAMRLVQEIKRRSSSASSTCHGTSPTMQRCSLLRRPSKPSAVRSHSIWTSGALR